ncbi:unnamed protein product [Caenorhabditis auriculariae]|uniref:Uncharacterized protein n=1 Tax=Caenorhabditis auriculariae TaxID=2777116 RepID=A0A8S1HA27_9PELO|nr:unnamed protein product [Caenorhabditis auriculariae]
MDDISFESPNSHRKLLGSCGVEPLFENPSLCVQGFFTTDNRIFRYQFSTFIVLLLNFSKISELIHVDLVILLAGDKFQWKVVRFEEKSEDSNFVQWKNWTKIDMGSKFCFIIDCE